MNNTDKVHDHSSNSPLDQSSKTSSASVQSIKTPISELRWLLKQGEQWESLNALELLSRFERGDVEADAFVKVSAVAVPKQLRYFIKELVWSAHAAHANQREKQPPHYDMVDHAPIPTALSDLGGRIVHVNQAFSDFIEYTREELIGMVVSEVSVSEDRESEITLGNEVLTRGGGSFQMQKRYLTKSGAERVGLLSISMLHDHMGAPEMVLAQIADLTRLQEMQAQLNQSRMLSALGEMAQLVTHDLKNILMVLRGTLDLIQSQVQRLDQEDAELIEEGLEVCASGERLVLSLLDLNVDGSPTLEPLNLHSLLPQLAQTLKRSSAPVPLTLELPSDQLTLVVLGKALWLERILMNLCVNARQAIESTGYDPDQDHIIIRLYVSSSENIQMRAPSHTHDAYAPCVIIEVEDSGEGISPALQRKLLKPYESTRRAQGGHGLGLTAVLTLCEKLQAHFSFSSELGIGSIFRVEIPLYSPEEALEDSVELKSKGTK